MHSVSIGRGREACVLGAANAALKRMSDGALGRIAAKPSSEAVTISVSRTTPRCSSRKTGYVPLVGPATLRPDLDVSTLTMTTLAVPAQDHAAHVCAGSYADPATVRWES